MRRFYIAIRFVLIEFLLALRCGEDVKFADRSRRCPERGTPSFRA